MKQIARVVVRCMQPLIIVFLSCFFERKYLQGRHFETGFGGYLWALRAIWTRSVLRLAPPRPWPVALTCYISNPENVIFHADDLNNFQSPGVYFQNFKACIHIGRGSYIAPNVGLITANHDLSDPEKHSDGEDIVLGERCWIGMNAVILPGVELGPGTVVAAGAIVSKSFPEGGVVIGGVPARLLKRIEIGS